jgi:adenosylhomocysteine nucleosidase
MIGVVVGMRSEARIIPSGIPIACSGGRPAKARALAERLLDEGATGLMSFGVAGALGPALRPGDLLVATGVVVDDHVFAAEQAWATRLLERLAQARPGLICGGQEVVATAAAKQALHARCGALAVDLESAAVAEACMAAGKPFAVLRAVADPAGRAIPALAMAGLGPDGETRPWAVAAGLLRRPQELPALLRLGGETGRALAALRAAVDLLGVGLGLDPV